MGALNDWQIRRDVKIEDAQPGIKRPGKISYGYSSMGYDARIAHKFRMIKPYPSSEIDPKNYREDMYEVVDLTPNVLCPRCKGTAEEPLTDKGSNPCMNCDQCFDLDKGFSTGVINVPDHIVIPPNSFVLGETMETFTIPRDCLCIVLGKSTYARCGVVANVTPGEPEWTGKWTIELSNTTPKPVRIYCGEGICQCIFLRTDGYREIQEMGIVALANEAGIDLMKLIQKYGINPSCEVSYKDKQGKYQDQTGVTNPMVDKEEKK